MNKWKVYTSNRFEEVFKKLDNSVQKQLKRWITTHLINVEDPMSFGKPLVGKYRGYWRYRIGDYRLIVEIQNDKLIIIMISIGHRKEIYKK